MIADTCLEFSWDRDCAKNFTSVSSFNTHNDLAIYQILEAMRKLKLREVI
jgi:hypothetical protein